MSTAANLHAFTGTFVDPALEAEFQEESYSHSARSFLRFSVPLAALAFLLYGIHDALVLGPLVHDAWKIRYGVFTPIAVVMLLIVRGERRSPLLEPFSVVFGAATTGVAVWIGALASGDVRVLYTCYAPLFVIMGPFLLRMTVLSQMTFTALTLVFFVWADMGMNHVDAMVRTSVSMTILTMGAMATLVSREQALAWRQSFLQRRTIAKQIAQLDDEKRRSEELLLNVLPPSIAERLKSSNSAIADGFAEVSVLFADIVGFTTMSARIAPAELVERLNEVFSSFDDLADKLRLEKIKTIGDAYMVAGGLNLERHDHAEALAEMALAMQRRMESFSDSFGEKLSLRIGIHTGPAVAGVIGKKKFIYDVWGDTVNTASRMESHGEPGRVHVTETVHARLVGKYEFVDRGEIEVKGKGKMHTYFLAGRKGVEVAKTRLPWET